uniref:Uncharacterized protein n=1 Tax=Fagus sylvatica TaxID=28930 RepID=A0A2N9EX27_FAGSY
MGCCGTQARIGALCDRSRPRSGPDEAVDDELVIEGGAVGLELGRVVMVGLRVCWVCYDGGLRLIIGGLRWAMGHCGRCHRDFKDIKTHNHNIHGTVRSEHRLKKCPPPKSCGGKTGDFQNRTPLTSKRTNGKEQAARLFRTNVESSRGSKGKRAIAEKVTPPKVDNKVDSVGDTKVEECIEIG